VRAKGFVCIGLLLLAAPGHADPLPLEQFTSEPRFEGLAISPSGKSIAVVQRHASGNVLMVMEFPGSKPRQILNFGYQLDVSDVRFVDDDNLLIQPSRLTSATRATKVSAGEIIRVDMKTGQSSLLYSTLAPKPPVAKTPARILAMHSSEPGDILIQTIESAATPRPGTVYRMDAATGGLHEELEAPIPDARFITGAGGRVMLAFGVDASGRSVVYSRPGATWVQKVSTRREEGELIPVAWTGEGEKYFALDTRDAPTRGVVIWDAATGTQKLLYRNPRADMVSFETDSAGRAWMFGGFDPLPVYWYPDPEHPLAVMHQKLAQALPKLWIEVTGQTDDQSTAIVRVSSAEQPPLLLTVDVATARPQSRLDAYEALKAETMAPVRSIEFKARDGLMLDGLLTTPRASDDKPASKLPLIVSVHGGPYGVSDRYDFEFERQLFASRGYAVLQVNFRGSGGRGREFMLAGFGEWGRGMQDDVTDGVRWAIEQGVADPGRICIVGSSYGAYAALMGAAIEPEMYKCAVGYSGVYDLTQLFASGAIQQQAGGMSFLKEALGEDQAELKARSPVNLAGKIRAKVMLVHGTDDSRAPFEQAKAMRTALTSAGNAPQMVVGNSESHGFSDPRNRAEAYRAMLNFLAASLGGTAEPPAPPAPKPPPGRDLQAETRDRFSQKRAEDLRERIRSDDSLSGVSDALMEDARQMMRGNSGSN